MTIKITLRGEQKTIPELTDSEIELMLDVCKNQHYISKDDKLFEVYDELIREQYRRKLEQYRRKLGIQKKIRNTE